MPPDMLVKLYDLNEADAFRPLPDGLLLKRAYLSDKDAILRFVKEEFPDEKGWPYECEYALLHNTCFIAVQQDRPVGFACFDVSAKGFFGPMGVRKELRGKGVGKALLLRSLFSMKEFGYAYAVIGWPAKNAVGFYKKLVGAVEIEGASPGKSVYQNMIKSF